MVALTLEKQMTQVHILAIDLAKRSFRVCGTDRGGAVLFNRVLSRARLLQLLNGHRQLNGMWNSVCDDGP